MAWGFSVSSSRCYGCKTCTVACANEKLLRAGVALRRVRQLAWEGAGGRPKAAFVSMACNHCQQPACLANCPVRAYSKRDDGLVVQDHALCIGCQTCVAVCPFHAPAYDPADSTTHKCDGCAKRIDRGLAPICEVSCPAHNIALGEYDQMLGLRAGSVDVRDMASTGPMLCLQPDVDLADALEGTMADIDGSPQLADAGAEGF